MCEFVRPLPQTATVSGPSEPHASVGGPPTKPPTDTASAPAAASDASRQTLSELLARILDQLTISAWLPAGAFVALLVLIANLRGSSGDLESALGAIGKLDLPDLLMLLGAVILATMVTQAFQFEAIRLLEGYWATGFLAALIGDLLTRRHLARRERLRRRLARLERDAFPAARQAMIADGKRQAIVDIIEAEHLDRPSSGSDADRAEAERIWWLDYVKPHQRRRHDAIVDALAEYPPESLLLPTRLGNTLRAYEEPFLHISSGPLEGVVMEAFDRLPAAVREEHDQFRGRLDLYCSLVLVFIVSGIVALGLLIPVDVAAALISGGIAVIAAWFSYRAAVASARKYGVVLATIATLSASK